MTSNALWSAIYSRGTATTAITSLLSGSTAIYDTLANPDATYPLVIFQQQADTTETRDANRREDVYVTIKAITVTGFKDGHTIDAAIDTAFNNVPLSVAGYTNIWLKRTGGVRYLETDAGKTYYHVGSIYRIRLSANT